MARKRQERAVKTSHKKGQKTSKSGNDSETDGFVSFNNNLAVLGLNLREVPGDGNCLFRALGDQLEGHGRNHLKHRLKTVEYMQQNRGDFEPFVEDDKSFDYHISNLSKPGIYAGNDAIVAFARLYGATVFIHQLDAPLWQINGGSGNSALGTELHIAYHNGDHYNSIRKLGDNSEAPANIRLGNQHQHVSENCGSGGEKFTADYQYCNSEDECEETAAIQDWAQTDDTKEQCSTSDSTAEIANIHRLQCPNDVSASRTEASEHDEIETNIMGKIGAAQSLPDIKGSSILVVTPNEKISNHKPLCRRLSNKERKSMKRAERKKASEERKRQSNATASRDCESEGDRVTWTILKDLGCLTI